MTQDELIVHCLARGRAHLDEGLALAQGVDVERLNTGPVTGEWSPAQVYKHLTLANVPYLDKVQPVVGSAPAGDGRAPFRHTWIGGFIAKQSGPGTNAPSPKALVPPAGPLPVSVVEEWAASHMRVLETIESCRGKDLNKRLFRNPFFPIFAMNLGDFMDILIAHTERHIGQINVRLGR